MKVRIELLFFVTQFYLANNDFALLRINNCIKQNGQL